MTPNEYAALALRTEADQGVILDRLYTLGPNAMRLDTAAKGLAADAGEVVDVIQKHIEYGKPLDRDHLKEEVGDVLWRSAQVCAAGGFTLEDAMAANLRKLAVRYPEKYSDEAANNRNLDAERYAMLEKEHFGDPDLKTGIYHPDVEKRRLKNREYAKQYGGRTVAEVEAAKRTPGGCCNRNADNMACSCLENAVKES